MATYRVLYTDHGFPDVDTERRLLAGADAELVVAACKTPEDVAREGAGADALLVQWAPVTAKAIASLERCRVIVRVGLGVDNVDLAAARDRGIPVCNVPDYCIDEVADHALALALALARQLPMIDQRVRDGTWQITPPRPMPGFRDMTFVTLGLGRIARAVLARARAFGFSLAACDPYLPDQAFADVGARRLSIEEAFAEADVLSLHSPLTPETRHLVGAERLAAMKPTAIVVNTSRGGLVDLDALSEALQAGHLGGAGLDVFDPEPLPAGHPLREAPRTVLTSHVAWYSAASVPALQRKAAEEVVRALQGAPLHHRVNS